MVRRCVLVVVMALLSATALAQRGPCAGDGPNPMFRFIPGNPDQLYFEHAAILYIGPPSVTIVGNDITVVQFVPAIPPPPFPIVLPPCNAHSVALGSLAPGVYNVTWNYQGQFLPEPFRTFPFTLVVPAATPALSQPAILGLMLACAAIGATMLRR
jgi:hypothetical protein